MNNWKLWWSKVLIPVLSLTGAMAQNRPETAPPYRPIPPHTEWTVKVTPLKQTAKTDRATDSGESGEQGPQLTKIQGRRSDSMRHEVVNWKTVETERWIAGGYLLETGLGRPDVMPTRYGKQKRVHEQRLSELPELEWLSPETYRQTVEYRERPCRYYEQTIVVKPEIDNDILELVKAGKIEMPKDTIYVSKAWIDAATNLPVAYENNDYRYEYTFTRADAPIKLSLPERFAQAARRLDPQFAP